ncbi:hypothetical protein EIP91_011103 [Steccherinum ochraceum]|uniref:Transmembrane protein n=1 Tax=Steccherinum ochraceum TaxID=92696 RepID=A0A4R0RVV7_9APHY|nr:hypothetical protein EIP91_011103 [Steccherinum ochraceum]
MSYSAAMLVNWSAASEIAKDMYVFDKLICSLFGLYVWELFQTCGFEWSLVVGRRRFTWPLVRRSIHYSSSVILTQYALQIFYFLCRYCIFFALIGLLISLSVTTPINCSALYTFNSWTGNMAILSASTSLMIRTFALWERQLKIVIPLGILCLAHWAILWRGMFIVHATYDDELQACVVNSTNHIFLNVSFFTTMGFDFTILCFTIAALAFRHKARSDLWHLLFRDGLVYFVITFMCNALPAVFNVINLNAVMNVIATIPAATISSIAACRLVVRLQDFNRNGDIFISSGSYSNQSPRAPIRPEVCITTDHFVLNDIGPISPGTATTQSPYTPVTPGAEKSTSAFEFKVTSDPIEEIVIEGDESEIFAKGKADQ